MAEIGRAPPNLTEGRAERWAAVGNTPQFDSGRPNGKSGLKSIMARTETVTVAFTDLVGSTELASRLGHDAYELLRRSHFDALRSAVANQNGSVIKTTGDGLML